VGTIHDMHYEVGLTDLLEGRPERLHELVRQMPDEADRVGEGVDPTLCRPRPAGGRVERGEERILDQYPRTGKPVQDGGLASVGIAGDRNARHAVPPANRALGVPYGPHVGDLTLEPGDPSPDPAPIGLDLGLTGPAQTHAATGTSAPTTAAGLARQRRSPTAKAGQEVLKLGQLNLSLALVALRVLGEDIQDQCCPVDYFDLDLLLQRAQLARRQLAVAYHRVGARVDHDGAQFIDLATADERGWVRPVAALDQAFEHLRAGRLRQIGQLGEGVVRIRGRSFGPDTDQHHPLEPQLAILDLGDVSQLGGEPGHAPQRVSLLQLELAGRVGAVAALIASGAVLELGYDFLLTHHL